MGAGRGRGDGGEKRGSKPKKTSCFLLHKEQIVWGRSSGQGKARLGA